MTLIAANIMGKLLYTTSLQWMNTLLCDYRPITGKCFATHLASLSCWVYKKMPIQKSASLTVSMRKNQSNFRWLTNQKAGYVYRNLDWFEKWQSDNGKGQLISEANFKVFIWTKNRSKIFLSFCPNL